MSTASVAAQSPRQASTSLFIPCMIVFFSGFCIMLVELVASQLVAGYIGRSLLTWTSVIGVILAGISVGNYLGGLLADRFESKRLVATLFALSALMSASILYVVDLVGTATNSWMGTDALWLARICVVVFGSFFLPGTALGMISPAIAKWALDYGLATGSTVGTIYAWNTIGSILGTFITGFFLIAWFEVQYIVWISIAGMALASLAFLPAIVAGGRSNLFEHQPLAPRPAGRDEPAAQGNLFVPSMLVFLSGFCIMLIELVASRLVAGQIGQSLYTWTSVIGVILAGITVGNYVGGRLADQFEARQLVGVLFLVSSVLCLSILSGNHLVGSATGQWMGSETPWWMRVFIVVFAAFFLPGAALGTISPAVAKWALERGLATGRTVGTIYSWNTIGSICGTFATGFYLISTFYVSRLIGLSSLVLALFAMWFLARSGTWMARLAAAGWLCMAAFVAGFTVIPADRFEEAVLAFVKPDRTTLGVEEASDLESNLRDIHTELLRARSAQRRLKPEHVVPPPFDFDAIVGKLDDHARVLRTAVEEFRELQEQKRLLESNLELQRSGRRLAKDAKGTETAKADIERLENQLRQLDVEERLRLRSERVPFDMQSLAGELQQLRKDLASWETQVERKRGEGSDAMADALFEARSSIDRALADRERRERNLLRSAAMLVSRHEEINIDDQYDPEGSLHYYDESNYYTIQVSEANVESNRKDDYETDAKGTTITGRDGSPVPRTRTVRQLVLDALVHGYVDLSDYTYLHYEYEHIYASVSHRLLQAHQKKGEKLRVLFLGGGSYTFPRYLTEYYKGPEGAIACDIAEIDPRVTRSVRYAMGMNQAKGKSFYLLSDALAGDVPTEANRLALASVNAGLTKGFRTLLGSLLPRRSAAGERLAEYARKIRLAGARRSESLSKAVDFVLDLRTTPTADAPAIEQARQLGLKVISPDEFQAMLDTTSHENIITHHMDARQYILQNQRKGEYDVIYGDAFNDFSVPSHLTTYEFNAKMAELLKPDGVFMANVIDIWNVSKFMGAYRNTLRKVFKHVYLLSTDEGEPSNTRSTFVLICSNVPLDLTDLGQRKEDVKGLVGSLMEGRLLQPVIRGGLHPLSDLVVTMDGSTNEIDLRTECGDVVVTTTRRLEPTDYQVSKGQVLQLLKPLPDGAKGNVTIKLSRAVNTFTCDGSDWRFDLPTYLVTIDSQLKVRPGGFEVRNDQRLLLAVPENKRERGEDGKAMEGVTQIPQPPPDGSKLQIRPKLRATSMTIVGDGKRTEYPLPDCDYQVVLTQELKQRHTEDKPNPKDPIRYRLVEGKKIVLDRPLPAGTSVRIRRFSTREVVLTDAYCPVDNLLAEVAATRTRD